MHTPPTPTWPFTSSNNTNSLLQQRLPWILCLHGGGVNANVFRVQTRKLRSALSKHFNFLFVNAPFPSEAGPGVLPVFEGCGDFLSWVDPATVANTTLFKTKGTTTWASADTRTACNMDTMATMQQTSSLTITNMVDEYPLPATAIVLPQPPIKRASVVSTVYELSGSPTSTTSRSTMSTHPAEHTAFPMLEKMIPHERTTATITTTCVCEDDVSTEPQLQCYGQEVRAAIDAALRNAGANTADNVVGVLGFSQGAIVATRILAEADDRWPALKFGILLCADYSPAMFPRQQSKEPQHSSGKCTECFRALYSRFRFGSPCSTSPTTKIRIPTVHLHGMSDPYLPRSRALLSELFDPSHAKLLEFQGGHHLPQLMRDTQRLAAAIVKVSRTSWYDVGPMMCR